MSFVIVPNVLSDTIYAKIDEQLALMPEAECDREVFYRNLVGFYNEHGYIPEFTLVNATAEQEGK